MVGRILVPLFIALALVLSPVSYDLREHALAWQYAGAAPSAVCSISNPSVPKQSLSAWAMASVAKGVVSCGSSALDGAWKEIEDMRNAMSAEGISNAAGSVVGAAKSVASCVWSPIECAQDAAQAARNTYNFVSDLVSNLSSVNINMSTDDLITLGCHFLGSMGPKMIAKILLGLITGGAAAATVALDIKKMFENIAVIQSMLKYMQRAKLSLDEVLKLSSEKMSELKSMMETMGPEKFNKEAAVCAAH